MIRWSVIIFFWVPQDMTKVLQFPLFSSLTILPGFLIFVALSTQLILRNYIILKLPNFISHKSTGNTYRWFNRSRLTRSFFICRKVSHECSNCILICTDGPHDSFMLHRGYTIIFLKLQSFWVHMNCDFLLLLALLFIAIFIVLVVF